GTIGPRVTNPRKPLGVVAAPADDTAMKAARAARARISSKDRRTPWKATGPACRPAPFVPSSLWSLRRQLADPRRPVGAGAARAGPVAGTTARAEDVVAGAAREERAAPVGVVAGAADVLAGDPDRVAVHGGSAVVAPPRADRVREPRLLVAGEPVVRGCSRATGHDVPRADAGVSVDRRVG